MKADPDDVIVDATIAATTRLIEGLPLSPNDAVLAIKLGGKLAGQVTDIVREMSRRGQVDNGPLVLQAVFAFALQQVSTVAAHVCAAEAGGN